MATREDFTDEQWASLAELPGRIIGAVAIADGKNLIKLAKEASAGGAALSSEIAKYPDNVIVQAMGGDGSFSAPKDIKSTEEAVAHLLSGVSDTFAMLREKASPEQLADVAALVNSLAVTVANAAGSGFFGGGDNRVDPREQAVIDQIAAIAAGS